ncbi:thioredoxin-disulfide reductase [Candidatus Pacearchaeota archaeon]|nr:thioredoxin-disulfide reductase [Candidatus Pacearchaeota archaeon]
MEKIYDVIIVGAGPAGYTAGIYSARAGHSVLMIAGSLPGGQLVNTTDVENFPGFDQGIQGPELMKLMRKQTEKFGTEIIIDKVVRVDFSSKPFNVFTKSKTFKSQSVIIATGASHRKLGLDSEHVFEGRGVSYCAICDGPLFKGQELVVVGGGDAAMEEAIFMAKFAKKIHVLHRGSKNELRASKIMQERAFNIKKIEFHFNTEVKEIKGDTKVREIIVINNKTHKLSTIKTAAVFIAIGQVPSTEIFKNHLTLDKKGFIVMKKNTQTSVGGVFAAGDVHDYTYRQAVTAAGYGCMAALDLDKYLKASEKH